MEWMGTWGARGSHQTIFCELGATAKFHDPPPKKKIGDRVNGY